MRSWLKSEFDALFGAGGLQRYALDLSDQRVSLVERTAAGPKVRDAAIHGSEAFKSQLEQLRRRVGGRRLNAEAPVDILLPRELTLARVETFPGEARRALRDEAWWRLDSITPYRPEELCFDVSLLSVEPSTGFLDVSVAVAPKDIVEEAVSYARRWGFAPQKVSASAPIVGFPYGPLFHRAADFRSETKGLRRGAAGLAAAAALLAAVGLTRGVAARDAQFEQVAAAAAAAEDSLDIALERRGAALALADRAMLPALRRQSREFAVDWLEALAATLPPDTVLDRLTVDGEHVRIEGVAANAEAALAAVNSAQAFRRPRLAALPTPVSLGRGATAQRFVIEARLSRVLQEEAAR